MEASPLLAKAAQDQRVYKTLYLRPLALHPLTTTHRYEDLMERCLTSGNAEAHYIKGIVQYFHNNNHTEGLQNLKLAAEGGYADAVYLYGIIMLCRGESEEGRAYLDKLDWQESKFKADRCWRNIKRSLHGMRIIRLPIYVATITDMRESIMCDIDDMENRCNHCYYFKQMLKFVFVI
ncbi:F-box protein At2g35280 [Eutrema salsugineum]|nr:F-box protein At2g35280 [Eutrema salsugineum]